MTKAVIIDFGAFPVRDFRLAAARNHSLEKDSLDHLQWCGQVYPLELKTSAITRGIYSLWMRHFLGLFKLEIDVRNFARSLEVLSALSPAGSHSVWDAIGSRQDRLASL